MGRAYEGSGPVERSANDFIASLFRPYGVRVDRQPLGPAHENLVVTAPGQESGAGTLLESHVDTVPADDWLDRAFVPRVDGNRIIGRGACDDKGPLTAMILALLDLLERR